MLQSMKRGLYRCMDRVLPPRELLVVEGEVLPNKLPYRAVVLVRDGAEDWCVGFRCPCGCGRAIELLLPKGVRPRWSYTVDGQGRPTLHPSIWLKSGCKSHFWIRGGKIIWL